MDGLYLVGGLLVGGWGKTLTSKLGWKVNWDDESNPI